MLYQENWTQQAQEQLRRFETRVVEATKVEGYDGKDPQDHDRQWSFSGALLYSVTVITTIGKPRPHADRFLRLRFNFQRRGSYHRIRELIRFGPARWLEALARPLGKPCALQSSRRGHESGRGWAGWS